jgi:hypothetical protein
VEAGGWHLGDLDHDLVTVGSEGSTGLPPLAASHGEKVMSRHDLQGRPVHHRNVIPSKAHPRVSRARTAALIWRRQVS